MPSTLTGTAQPLLRELIDIPERVYQGDFVLRLTEGVQRRQATLDSYVITPQLLAGMLSLSRSLVAAADRRPADADAALEHAAELAQRTGQGNAYLMGFGPTNVGLWQMAAALEVKDYERAATIAEQLNPAEHPSRERRATYWMD